MSAESEPQPLPRDGEGAYPARWAADSALPARETVNEGVAAVPGAASGMRVTAPRASHPLRPRASWDAPAPEAPLPAPASGPAGASGVDGRAALLLGDRGAAFVLVSALAWLALVGLPLSLSLVLERAGDGWPLAGVVVWLALLRGARWLSPAARADRLLRGGRYTQALAVCDAALAVRGDGAWQGMRRLVWLNRRASALLGIGRYDEALRASLAAVEMSSDPETIATCALALLRLNRYADAVAAARLASGATHERSVRANATLAACMLVRGQPAEAEALASASLADSEALRPYVRSESHAACLSALFRARLAQGRLNGPSGARVVLARLNRIAGRDKRARAAAMLEEAALAAATGGAEGAAQAELLALRARALSPGYALWRLAQPDAPRTTLNDGLELALSEQEPRAPTSLAVMALLNEAHAAIQERPPALSNRAALLVQIITVAATLVLLALWTLIYFRGAGAS